jgi:glycerol-3-phosphate dehydrogenase subunit B
MRLHNILRQSIEKNGGKVINGQQAMMADCGENRVKAVYTEAAARYQPHTASLFVLATGGVLGGGYIASPAGLKEAIFDLPLKSPPPEHWFNDEFLSPTSHPIFLAGLSVDEFLRPIKESKELVYENLFAAGAALGGVDPLVEHSLEGIALATGFAVGRQIA